MYDFSDYFLYIGSMVRNAWYLARRKIFKKLKIKTVNKQEKVRYGYQLLTMSETQKKIMALLDSKQPFMVARIGGVEGRVCAEKAGVELGLKKKMSPKWVQKAYINAGFFPPDESALGKFYHIMEESLKEVDILGSMKISPEEFLIRRNLKDNACLTEIACLEPYYCNEPWTQALEGKKVLVIHPFSETIKKQYQKRKKIFSEEKVLPDFELKTLKAVQSIAGTKTEFSNWFEALDRMYCKAMEIDFDVAIIGCGAYGLPLAAKLKQSGKQAIHLGGAVQVLFGIIGSRWNSVSEVKKMMNEYWVHPSGDEIPENANAVEGGCYW